MILERAPAFDSFKCFLHKWFVQHLGPQSKDFMVYFQVSERKHSSEKMVKNKNVGGRLSRAATSKAKKAGSQIASSKELNSLDDPAGRDIPAVSSEVQTTSQSQLDFPDRVYLLASVIFQNNHLEKPAAHRVVNYGKERGLPLPEVKDEDMQRTAYELAFSTLKCKCNLHLIIYI